jgi:hypothetical protein
MSAAVEALFLTYCVEHYTLGRVCRDLYKVEPDLRLNIYRLGNIELI